MYAYLYVESKTGKGFQFIPCSSAFELEQLKEKIDKLGLFNTSVIRP